MNKFIIKPLYDKIVVKRIQKENKKKNLIISINKTNNIGKVIAIGQGRLSENGNLIPLQININDIVLFSDNYNVKEEIINEEEYLFMSENDILAILEE